MLNTTKQRFAILPQAGAPETMETARAISEAQEGVPCAPIRIGLDPLGG